MIRILNNFHGLTSKKFNKGIALSWSWVITGRNSGYCFVWSFQDDQNRIDPIQILSKKSLFPV